MFKRKRIVNQSNKPSNIQSANTNRMQCVKKECNRQQVKDHNCLIARIATSSFSCRNRFSRQSKWLIVFVDLFIVLLAISSELERDTPFTQLASASLIIGDSAIEIQEVDNGSVDNQQQQQQQPLLQQQQQNEGTSHQSTSQTNGDQEQPSIILGSTDGPSRTIDNNSQLSDSPGTSSAASQTAGNGKLARVPSGPLPPLQVDDITDGDQKSRNNHDYDISELNGGNDNQEKGAINKVMSVSGPKKTDLSDKDDGIAGKVVDFELTPAGGHNKAKIKKKKMKKAKKNEEKSFMQWGKKKKAEKKAVDMLAKKSMKTKKEEGKKAKKKWGHEEHGQKKKGKFKKKKWGSQVKKGKGIKKGKKGKKFLKDVGHKNTGFKTVYHKEEWGKSNKWHDIKREKKWDEKSKKWKDKWKKEKGKKYKGDHMKKFEAQKKAGKKYKKEKKNKFKKSEKEKYAAGKKMKKEEHKKKKEGGAKKEMEEMKKKKKKKKP